MPHVPLPRPELSTGPAPCPAVRAHLLAPFHSASPLIRLRLFFYAVRSAPPLAKRQRGAGPAPRNWRTFSVSLPLLPGIPLSAFSRLFGSPTSQALRAQGFTDVISLRCADTRRWRKEQLRRPSLLLLGCYSSGVMAPSLWKGLVGIGLFALAHAAFSAAQRKCLRDGDLFRAGLRGRRVGAPLRECRTACPGNGHLRP